MLLLTAGILLFMVPHLMPSVLPGTRARLWERLGESGYKGLFSLLVAAGLVLMVVGWRSALPQAIYAPPAQLHTPALIGMLLAFWLLVVGSRNSRLRQIIRHPQLSGVLLWALCHLLLNGDSRSLLLFGSFAIWAALEMLTISRHEGPWQKPEPPAWSSELVTVLATGLLVAVTIWAHPWFAGMPVR